jgi:outer membrane protein OmpA-like peptidoglycan-associated protein
MDTKFNSSNTKFQNIINARVLLFFCGIFFVVNNHCLIAQNPELVSVTGVVSGFETNNALFKAISKTIPNLAYIRAQRIDGPQDGIFTLNEDNIRYTAISKVEGIPGNRSIIRFTFLQADKVTPISPRDFRLIINDIDGPNNEALATNCNDNLKFLGTADPTHINVINLPPTIIAVGQVGEEEGATSRVMFEFTNVAVIELENYANDGYLKDFDMNNQYPIADPILVKCGTSGKSIYTSNIIVKKYKGIEFTEEENVLKVNTKPIYFDTDKAEIRPDAEVELEKVLNVFKTYENVIIEIRSYTDSRANDAYNLKLSQERALASINWFINKGVNPARIKGEGYGETQLVNECANGVDCTEEQHQLNRRTEFVIVNPEVIQR